MQTDAYALRSQRAWAAAHAAGVFAAELAPIDVKGKKGPETMAHDECPRPETTREGLHKLPTVFKKDGTVTAGARRARDSRSSIRFPPRVHAGSASAITDGAASLVIASDVGVAKYGLKPMARVVGWAVAGVQPSEMGIGPAPAIRKVLAQTGISLAQVDLVEVRVGGPACRLPSRRPTPSASRVKVNEAFAAQYLAVEKELGLVR